MSKPLSDLTYEITTWPASAAYIENPEELLKPVVEFASSKTPYPIYAGLTVKTDIPKFWGIIGWESMEAHAAAIRGEETVTKMRHALAPLFADPTNPQNEILHAHWPEDPAKHILAPLVEMGFVKRKEGTSVEEAEALLKDVQKAFDADAEARGIVAKLMFGTIEERPGEWIFILGYESDKVPKALVSDEKMVAVFAESTQKMDYSMIFGTLKKYA